MIDEIKKWLKSKNVSLWLSWNLVNDDELDEAARFFQATVQEWSDFRYANAHDARWKQAAQARMFAPNVEFDVV